MGLKQDETHNEVLGLKDDIGDVRVNIDDIALAISRCESSLGDAAGRQTYMSRGVRLLVQCVGDLLRPSNPAVAAELEHFATLSTEEMDDDFYYRDGGVNTPLANRAIENGNRRGGGEGRAITYHTAPASPNLSEIGSVDDNSVIRPMSLPRPRRQPSSSSSGSGNIPASTSKIPTTTPAGNYSPFATPSGPLQMLRSMNSRSTMSSHRQGSCPEDEVPVQQRQQREVFVGNTSVINKDNKESSELPGLDEVDHLLSVIRRGEVPAGV